MSPRASPANEFCSTRAFYLYLSILRALYGREWFVRAGTLMCSQAGLPRAGDQIPKPSERRERRSSHGRQAANTSYDLGIRDLGPRHGRPQLIAHRRRPAVRPSCRQPAGRPHHQKSPLACGTPSPTPTAATAPTVRSSRASWASDTDDENIKQAFDLARASRASNITLTSRATTPPSTPTPSTST